MRNSIVLITMWLSLDPGAPEPFSPGDTSHCREEAKSALGRCLRACESGRWRCMTRCVPEESDAYVACVFLAQESLDDYPYE